VANLDLEIEISIPKFQLSSIYEDSGANEEKVKTLRDTITLVLGEIEDCLNPIAALFHHVDSSAMERIVHRLEIMNKVKALLQH
jgi:hypothetical protein